MGNRHNRQYKQQEVEQQETDATENRTIGNTQQLIAAKENKREQTQLEKEV